MKSPTDWLELASRLAPLSKFAVGAAGGGEAGVLVEVFNHVPRHAGFALELRGAPYKVSAVASLVRGKAWQSICVSASSGASGVEIDQLMPGGVKQVVQAVTSENLNHVLTLQKVPFDLDCLCISTHGLDWSLWNALDKAYTPSLVVVEFNPFVPFDIAAAMDEGGAPAEGAHHNYGASWSALLQLAAVKGYRLIHIHGCWKLYFLRNDLSFPAELCAVADLSDELVAVFSDVKAAMASALAVDQRALVASVDRPDPSTVPWMIVPPRAFSQKKVDINGLALQVLDGNGDAAWYQQRKAFEEKASFLYPLVAAGSFENFVDVGANVGFISKLVASACPSIQVIAVEADPRLASLYRENLAEFGHRVRLFNAVAGQAAEVRAGFSLNPHSTLDNRVSVAAWPQVFVPQVELSGLLSAHARPGRTFFKIDTQGYELSVLRGAESWLMARTDWMLKMEFAPNWLRSQGTDPAALLDYLQLRYEFVEYPERIPFGVNDMDQLFHYPIGFRQQVPFLKYVESLNKNGLGWVDLLVRPKS